MKLAQRVALVTGGGRGIGRAIALSLAEAGCDVAVSSRTEREVAAVAAEVEAMGRRAVAHVGNIADEEDVQDLVDRAVRKLGPIHILVNNAGSVCRKPLIQNSINDWDNVQNSHLRGMFLATRLTLPGMLEQGWGRIVTISSIAGKLGVAHRVAYCTAKWGQIGFTEALNQELRSTRVRAHVVCPGPVATRMRAEGFPEEMPETLIQPEDVASQVLYLLTLPETANVPEIVMHPGQPIRYRD